MISFPCGEKNEIGAFPYIRWIKELNVEGIIRKLLGVNRRDLCDFRVRKNFFKTLIKRKILITTTTLKLKPLSTETIKRMKI